MKTLQGRLRCAKLRVLCRQAGAGLVGLSLSYALAITGLLNGLLTSFAETEQEMVAVERILEYTDLEPQVCVTFMPHPVNLHVMASKPSML